MKKVEYPKWVYKDGESALVLSEGDYRSQYSDWSENPKEAAKKPKPKPKKEKLSVDK